jgi:hypothetical protein
MCYNFEWICFYTYHEINPIIFHICTMSSLSLTLLKLRLSTRSFFDVSNSTRMNYKDGSYCGTFLERYWGDRSFRN